MAAPARPKERRPLADSGKHRLLLAREGSGSGSATRRLGHANVGHAAVAAAFLADR